MSCSGKTSSRQASSCSDCDAGTVTATFGASVAVLRFLIRRTDTGQATCAPCDVGTFSNSSGMVRIPFCSDFLAVVLHAECLHELWSRPLQSGAPSEHLHSLRQRIVQQCCGASFVLACPNRRFDSLLDSLPALICALFLAQSMFRTLAQQPRRNAKPATFSRSRDNRSAPLGNFPYSQIVVHLIV